MWNSLFNLLQSSFMWLFQVRFSSRVTPRNLLWDVLFICCPLKTMESGRLRINFLLDLKIVKEDLSELRVNLLALNQVVNCNIMFFPLKFMSLMLLQWKNIVVSSAKSLTLPSGQQLGKSLINKRKNNGPRTEPWGTPWDIERIWDLQFSMLTYWLRLFK